MREVGADRTDWRYSPEALAVDVLALDAPLPGMIPPHADKATTAASRTPCLMGCVKIMVRTYGEVLVKAGAKISLNSK